MLFRSLGRNRVERATRFANAVRRVGAVVQLTIVPATGHEFTPATISSAVNFLRAAEIAAADRPSRLLAEAPVVAPPPEGTRADGPWWQRLVDALGR